MTARNTFIGRKDIRVRVADWKDYELIDTSAGERLERWGDVLLIRPDPQIIWDTEKRIPDGKTPMPDTTAPIPEGAPGRKRRKCLPFGKSTIPAKKAGSAVN